MKTNTKKVINVLRVTVLVLLIINIVQLEISRKLNIPKTTESVVRKTYIEYTYTCENCKSDVAEGSYSFVENEGYEECDWCGVYIELEDYPYE